MLRRAIAILALTIAAAGLGPVQIALVPIALAQGNLSQEERSIVSRNPMLVTLQQDDPGAFRKILAMLGAHAEKTKQPPSRQRQIPLRQGPEIDLSGNPDLQELQKSSPEAAHELFLVLKQAGAIKPKKN